jgi:recombination protein RecA
MMKTFKDLVGDKFGDLFEVSNKELTFIPTGALSLDVSIGRGGIPRGRFTEIAGPEASGKTHLALNIAKQVLKTGEKVLYVDPEHGVDVDLINSIVGEFDPVLLEHYQPGTAEEALEICEMGIASHEFALVVLDSIGALAPKKEKDDDLTDANVGLLSRLLTKFSRRNGDIVHRSNTAFIGVNQVRDKIGAYYPTLETPGGHSWKHILALRIMLARATDIEQNDVAIGINTKFTIKKNKLAPPFRSFTIPIMFGKGIDEFRDFVQFAAYLGIIQTRGSYYAFEGETIGQGLVKTMAKLQEDKLLLDKIQKMCYNVITKVKVEQEDDDGEDN